MAPSFLIVKGKTEAKIKRRTLTTRCYNAEDARVARGEARPLLELMPERKFPCGETASEAGRGVPSSVLATTPTVLSVATAHTVIQFNHVPHTILRSSHTRWKFKIDVSCSTSQHRAGAKADSGRAAETAADRRELPEGLARPGRLSHPAPMSSQSTVMDIARQQITGKQINCLADLGPSYFLWQSVKPKVVLKSLS